MGAAGSTSRRRRRAPPMLLRLLATVGLACTTAAASRAKAAPPDAGALLRPFLLNGIVGFVFATFLSCRGLRKQSLSRSGAMAAWVMGFLTMLVSLRFGALLILFYQSSSSLTKFRAEVKARFEEDHQEGGQRSAAQVLACSLLATAIAALHALYLGPDDWPLNFASDPLRSRLLCAFVGHYACCNGDTWASVVGILSPSSPRLVTSLLRKRVPRGTNGGISFTGTCASVAGGAFIGAGHTLAGLLLGIPDDAGPGGFLPAWAYMTVLGAICGFLGSLIDSVVGGLLQPTWYCAERKTVVKHPTAEERRRGSVSLISGAEVLTNEQVNALSVLLTTALAPSWARRCGDGCSQGFLPCEEAMIVQCVYHERTKYQSKYEQ